MYDTITKKIGDRNIKEDYSWLVDMNKTRCKYGKKMDFQMLYSISGPLWSSVRIGIFFHFLFLGAMVFFL